MMKKVMMKKVIGALFVLLLFPNASGAEDFIAARLADGIYQLTGPAGNTLVAVDHEGLILVDGVPAEYADQYLALVKRETGIQQIKALINSHWHPEVTGLNAILGPQGVEIIAHDNTRQWLAATIRKRGEAIIHKPFPDSHLPTATLYFEGLSRPYRDAAMEIGYLLQAHTDGDIYVYFPAENVLYASVLRSDSWSTVDEATNGFLGGLLDAYETLSGMIDEDTIIVPGSGPLLDRAAFLEQQEMYQGLMARMVEMLRSGQGVSDVVAANPALGLRPEWGPADEFLEQGFRSFYGHLRNGRHLGVMP